MRQIFGVFIASGFLLALSAKPAQATVIEFDRKGKVVRIGPSGKPYTIKPSQNHQSREYTPRRLSRLSQNQLQLRKLAMQTALRYAGHDGVIRAGFNSLTFADLFTSLIHLESNFNPDAVSSRGAKGLGQLMDETARKLQVTDVFDPHQNLDASAKYFIQLLARFESAELALAAYNAGPRRVQRYGGIPPFPETRQYIIDVFHAAGLAADLNSSLANQNKTIPTRVTGEQSVWEY